MGNEKKNASVNFASRAIETELIQGTKKKLRIEKL